MLPGVTVTTRPLAPPTPSGRPGAYGIHEATLTAPGRTPVWGRGLSAQAARDHALRRAALEWAEVEATLTALDLEAAAVEAGDLDLRD